ncbi:MAG: hypothetical protein Tsb009_38870 [Planctomycetaceae bacterium]
MTPLQTQCPHCDTVIKLKSDKSAGREVPCSHCGEFFIVEDMRTPDHFELQDSTEFSEDRWSDNAHRASSWKKVTLIGLGCLVVLAMLGGGVYLATKLLEKDNSPQAQALAWLPKDAEFIGVFRTSELYASPELEPYKEFLFHSRYLDGMVADLGLDSASDIEVFALGLKNIPALNPGSGKRKSPPFIMTVKSKVILKPTKMRQDSDIKTHNRTSYYLKKRSWNTSYRTAFFQPDDRTIVLGDEETIKEVIEQGPVGHQRSDLGFVDFSQPMVVAYVPKNGSVIPDTFRQNAKGMTAMFPDLAGIISRKIEKISIGMKLSEGLHWKLRAVCASESEAKAVKTDLQKLRNIGKDYIKLTTANAPPEVREAMLESLDSLRTSTDNLNVDAELHVSESQIEKVYNARKRQQKRRRKTDAHNSATSP